MDMHQRIVELLKEEESTVDFVLRFQKRTFEYLKTIEDGLDSRFQRQSRLVASLEATVERELSGLKQDVAGIKEEQVAQRVLLGRILDVLEVRKS